MLVAINNLTFRGKVVPLRPLLGLMTWLLESKLVFSISGSLPKVIYKEPWVCLIHRAALRMSILLPVVLTFVLSAC